ncbi:hypothetical protein PTKIN_Ptkin01aG0330200 [Pterospermum kingtungense]
MADSTDVLLPDKKEEDQLARSNKKVNFGDGSGALVVEERVGVVKMRPWVVPCTKFPMMSWRRMVSKEVSNVVSKECPTIRVPMEEKRRLRGQWSKALIIKLLGHMVGYNFLVRRLKSLWQISSDMNLIVVGFEVYVQFAIREEYDWVLFNVTSWYHNFDPETFSVFRLAVWVRFSNLTMKYFDEDFLMRLGRHIGMPLKVDSTTLSTLKGRFARLCMEVDLSKPLLSTFWLRRKVRTINVVRMDTVRRDVRREGIIRMELDIDSGVNEGSQLASSEKRKGVSTEQVVGRKDAQSGAVKILSFPNKGIEWQLVFGLGIRLVWFGIGFSYRFQVRHDLDHFEHPQMPYQASPNKDMDTMTLFSSGKKSDNEYTIGTYDDQSMKDSIEGSDI